MEKRWNTLHEHCPTRSSLAKIANKWTALIVITLEAEPLRFGQIAQRVEGISKKVLVDTLRDLERDGIIVRWDFNEVPRRVEYELTDLGMSLFAPLEALNSWAEDHIEQVLEARERFDSRISTFSNREHE